MYLQKYSLTNTLYPHEAVLVIYAIALCLSQVNRPIMLIGCIIIEFPHYYLIVHIIGCIQCFIIV